MSEKLESLNISFVQRNAPASGPTSSEAWNDSMEELAIDLSRLSTEWAKIYQLLSTVPYGYESLEVDAFANGLDGKGLWVDAGALGTDDDLTFWSDINGRPVTVYEAFRALYLHIDNQLQSTVETIVDAASGLTADQKTRIGDNIFDVSQASSADSIDGRSQINQLNIVQLAKDLYDIDSYSLIGDGVADLTYSVKDMVNALLVLHNGSWHDNITLNHTGAISSLSQDNINTSHSGNDAYSGTPTHLREDLNIIRTQIKNLKGTVTWLTSLSSLYIGGANSLEGLLANTKGSGTKTATNPWGYQYDNIDGLIAILNAIISFTGQTIYTDGSPAYSSTTYINNGDSLETAVGKLDARTTIHNTTITDHTTQLGALLTFVGQDSISDNWPSYSSNAFINNGDSLETAIGKLDSYAATMSGQLKAKAFLSLTDTPSSYASQKDRLLRVNNLETALEFTDYVEVTSAGEIKASGYIVANGFLCHADIEITKSGQGLVLSSPNGTRWRVTIDNAGNLDTTSI